ncbi:putative ABC-type sugar transport system, permease component [Arthrobacter sp. PAMC 25486]|uniref:carbohydrate ABC transporter permease n=1 Tax=Arthrobacter sp. PAMC 25486 TaxID=1494608 RepID=UPI000536174F|nr:carbohydrate ABC transporter permease [Arthrobacter sp. PAMC 25486]AIY02966.1 putative ABC-type sugar transport system, permease component [Arthrobacter sp. PAMC 25486]
MSIKEILPAGELENAPHSRRLKAPGKRSISKPLRIALLVALVVFSGFPLFWMLNTALSTDSELYGQAQSWWPHWERLVNFGELLGGVPIMKWLANSLVIATGTTVLSLIFAVLAGYALSRFKFHGKGVAGFLLFATQMLPEALLVVPIYSLFASMGLLNGMGGLVLANVAFTMPVSVWIIKGAIDSIPYEIEEAAAVDGCPKFTVLSMVLTPLILPSIAAAAVINFFDGWNEFLFAKTFIAERDLWPASVGLSSFIGQYLTSLNSVMAAALLFTLPALVFFLLVQRHIVSGLTAGSVKG